MATASRATSAPASRQRRCRPLTLPSLGISAAASSMAATATSSMSLLQGVMRLQRKHFRQPKLPICLPGLPEEQSSKCPEPAIDDPCGEIELLHPHAVAHVALMRWVFHEARNQHLARPSYQARIHDTQEALEKGEVMAMSEVILREVLADVWAAARRCCKANRAIGIMSQAAHEKTGANDQMKHRTLSLNQRFQRLRNKLFVTGVLCKMLRKVREESDKAESMWKQCCAGLGSLSLPLASRSLNVPSGSRSLRLRSCRPCGSISLGLRKLRRTAANMQ